MRSGQPVAQIAVQTTPVALWSRVDVTALHRALLTRISHEQSVKRAYRVAVRSQVAARVERARERLLEAHAATMRARAAEESARAALRRLDAGGA